MAVPNVASMHELFACAAALERRAAERYRLLADSMAKRRRPDLAELFDRLAREEERHAAWVRARAGGEPGVASVPEWPAALGEAPETPNPEEIARLSPYACLANAVRNEQKAFSFFSYMAAEAKDPEIAAIAEDLAREELQHAALLRHARRRAWRRERRTTGPWPKPSEIASHADLLRAASAGEADLVRELAAAGARIRALDDLSRETSARLRAAGVSLAPSLPGAPPGGEREILDGLVRRAEAAFDFYDAVASAASDEAVMLSAQELTGIALERLKALRRLA